MQNHPSPSQRSPAPGVSIRVPSGPHSFEPTALERGSSTHRALALALACGLLLSCSPGHKIPKKVRERHAHAATSELERIDTPLRLRDVYWHEEALYLSYVQDGQLRLGVSSADARQNLDHHQDWMTVYQLFAADPAAFQTAREKGEKIVTLPEAKWKALGHSIVVATVPSQQERGVLLNARDEEAFFFRDSEGSMQRVPKMVDQPRGVRLYASIRLEKKNDELFELIESYFQDEDIEFKHAMLDTGEIGSYARPFVIVNRETSKISFLTLEPFTIGSMPDSGVTTGGKLGWHLLRSFGFDLVNRPLSNVSRLFFLVSDTIADGITGTVLGLMHRAGGNDEEIPPLYDGPGMDLAEWETKLDEIGMTRRRSGRIKLLVDGDQFFPYFIDAIVHAEESIKLRTYIFDRDDFAIDLANLLRRRSEEIDVQVMLDGLGTLMAQNTAAGTMPSEHEAPVGITTYLTEGSDIRLASLTNPWTAGDHTKTTIIDGKTAFIGGMNVGREYRWEWHDIMMAVEGPIVDFIAEDFDRAWAQSRVMGDFVYAAHVLSHPEKRSPLDGYEIRPLRTLPAQSQIFRSQLLAARSAKRYIYVSNAYLSDAQIVQALADARLRGVDVRVIIPMEGNHGIMNANNVTAANKLFDHGVRVFAYPGMSHVKAAVYDGWACLGSANFDKLSFRVNKEMNLGVSDPRFVEPLLEEVFAADFAASVELKEPLPEGWDNTFASIIASQL